MAKRGKRLDLGRYEPPPFSDEAALADVVDDAMLIALAGVRLTVKNIIIVRALRDLADYDDEWYVRAIVAEFEALASEKDHDADRVAAAITAAEGKRGRGVHPNDYRPIDVATLARRELTLRALATRLRALNDDPEAIHALSTSARDAALRDMADSIQNPRPPAGSLLSDADRADALSGLIADLHRLSD